MSSSTRSPMSSPAIAPDAPLYDVPPGRGAHLKAGLILLTLALFATSHLVNYGMALLALGGVVDVIREPRATLRAPGPLLLVLFAVLWLPMLVASVGALDARHAWQTTWPYLHYLPAAWFVARACAEPAVLRLVTVGTGVLVSFTALDAFIQLLWHVDLFGFPYDEGILKGLFYPKQRLGLLLAVFAVLELVVIRRAARRYPWLWLLLLPFALVILVSLKRAAWIMLALGLILLAVQRWRAGIRPTGRRLLQASVLALGVLVAAAWNPAFKARLAESSGMFSARAAAVDTATGYRWSLWRTGAAMVRAHWLRGIGPRGYRHAYAEYAPSDDFWMRRFGHGQTHPHLFALEVVVECGVIGLLGFAAFYALLLRACVGPTVGHVVPVWLIGAAVAAFPLNAHLAFYSAYWSSLVWLLLGIGLAERRPRVSVPA